MTAPATPAVLASAQRKAARRLLPLLFLSYVIAYVDRANVGLAKLTMAHDLPAFNDEVIGFGAGLFFWGYVLLEVPSTLFVEKGSARRLLSRIMIVWGVCASLTALVRTPGEFYAVRFCLGLAEAGFFPGVIVYLTHWFPGRARIFSLFLIATPAAQILSPKISNALLKIGAGATVGGVVQSPPPLGLHGWQWLYLFWGLPAVVLGLLVLWRLDDWPRDARWLTEAERAALEAHVDAARARRAGQPRLTVLQAFRHPHVLLLALAFCCGVTANYGVEFFLPSILKKWYSLDTDAITWLVMLPPCLAVAAQLFVGWNSDRTRERRGHAVGSLVIGLVALALAPASRGHLPLTVACFMVAAAGIKGYQPAFWALPGLFLTEAAAAGSVGLINSIGQIGGFIGPTLLGYLEHRTNSYSAGLYCLSVSMGGSAAILFFLGLGRRDAVRPPASTP